MPALLGEGTAVGAAGATGTATGGLTTVAILPSHCSGRGRSLVGTGTTVGAAAGGGGEGATGAAGAGAGASDRGHSDVLVQARGSFGSVAAVADGGPVHNPLAEFRLLLLLFFVVKSS